MLQGFKNFVLRGNIIDLAVAVIIGAAFSSVVSALVKDLITPLIAAIGGQPDFSKIAFEINGSKFLIGDFFNTVLSFLINATVIYFLIVIPMEKLLPKKKPDFKEKTCPECLSSIPKEARRCKFCSTKLSD